MESTGQICAQRAVNFAQILTTFYRRKKEGRNLNLRRNLRRKKTQVQKAYDSPKKMLRPTEENYWTFSIFCIKENVGSTQMF
ncbi:unnamed protein product [Lepidochelys kempii]